MVAFRASPNRVLSAGEPILRITDPTFGNQAAMPIARMLANAQSWGGCWDPPRRSPHSAFAGSTNSPDFTIAVAPQQLQERETDQARLGNLLGTALETATDSIVLHDLDGKITFWNAAAAKDWGWATREAIGKSVGPLLFIDQEHFARIRETLDDQKQWRGHVATMSKTGKLLVRHASISRWVEDADSSPGTLMSCRPAEMLDMEPAAILRMERLKALSRSVSKRLHELNNALSPITMSVDLLRSRLQAPADQRVLAALQEATAWSARVTEQLHADLQEAIEPLLLPS